MLPKKGRKLHLWDGLAKSAKDYAELIAGALGREHDDTHRTVKTIMRWTGASERSVKNWLSGVSGPSGYYLMRLCVKSAAIRALVMDLLSEPGMPSEPHGNVSIQVIPTMPANAISLPLTEGCVGANGDTNGDIIGDMHVTNNSPLNERQEWLLARVAQGERCRFEDIVSRWQVSSRTAKRDIASLKDSGLLRYLGRHRSGAYVVPGRRNRPS